MKGLLLLIAVCGLLAVGWMNRERFLGNPEQASAGESSPTIDLSSTMSRLSGGVPASTPHPAREAQARATTIYPGIARLNSPLNQKFVALYKEAQTSNPALLSSPDWPLDLAERAVVSMGGAPMPRTVVANARPAAPTARSRKNVVIYTTSHCPYCKQAKRYFAQKGISVREVDIEASLSGKQEYRNLNGDGVPLIMVDGQRVEGFNERILDSLL